MWTRDGAFRAATVHPRLLTAVAQVTGHPFLPWNDSMVTKQPHTNTPVEFHQDPPYYKPDLTTTFGVPDFVVDVYLDDSTVDNGCVHGIAGRHLLGTVDLKSYSEDELFTECNAVPMTMQPGDVLFHALSAPHGSRNNPTSSKRSAFYLNYKALEIEDWKDPATRSMTYDAAGVEKVKGFIAERAARGLDANLPDGLSLAANGFVWAAPRHATVALANPGRALQRRDK